MSVKAQKINFTIIAQQRQQVIQVLHEKHNLISLAGASEFLFLVITSPAFENSVSLDTDVAGQQRNWRATAASMGNVRWFDTRVRPVSGFGYWSILVSIGGYRYWPILILVSVPIPIVHLPVSTVNTVAHTPVVSSLQFVSNVSKRNVNGVMF